MSSVAEKLRIAPANRVFLAGADDARRALIEPLPELAVVVAHPRDGEVALVYAADQEDLDLKLELYLDDLLPARAVWIAYRKGGASELNRNVVGNRMREIGWDLVANIAIDDEWSAVRAKPLGR